MITVHVYRNRATGGALLTTDGMLFAAVPLEHYRSDPDGMADDVAHGTMHCVHSECVERFVGDLLATHQIDAGHTARGTGS